ncbi:hypothetical protein E3N88_43204 [Mikania micrantha]|uniref:Uncharacterized protein n=1 Tax=Mikania micrantha TaxID=192012 RepID=A0A5N6LFQ3_9ASTR|nr:hypothetical protein E3N88_43204 [Mikania micrantha]
MEENQQTYSSSPSPSSPNDDQRLDPDDSVDQSAAEEVSFGFNHLQIYADGDSNLLPESLETDVEDQQDDDDGDFTFVCVGDNDSPTIFPLFDRSLLYGGDYDAVNSRLPIDVPVDKVFTEPRTSPSEYGVSAGTVRDSSDGTGFGKTVFPLFDRSLLLGEDYDAGKLRLPIDVSVNKVFIESQRPPFEDAETDRTVMESSSPEINMKSNSTGFSKLWRVRDEIHRSNSDSRDAFVFLEAKAKAFAGGGSTAKVDGAGAGGGNGKAVRNGSNTKKSASAHEVYLKQKEGRSEDERRRSYLPYRPGLLGFFTNVNGGLTKNVHPF